MTRDLLAGAAWECCATAPGTAAGPGDLGGMAVEWLAAAVPGTAASAVASASGRRYCATVDFDDADWWFRCRVPAGGDGGWTLTCDGLATVADVWLGADHVLHSENMFVSRSVELDAVAQGVELVIRCAALTPLLGIRRPRPRWKTQMANHQSLRWFRTSYLGRQPGWAVTPAPVGPWRPVRLERTDPVRVVGRRVVAGCEDDGTGVLSVMVRLVGAAAAPDTARVRVERLWDGASGERAQRRGGQRKGDVVEGRLGVRAGDGGEVVVEGELTLPGRRAVVAAHPRGAASLPGDVEVGGVTVEVGRVGFRRVSVDRTDGAFTVVVNGVEVFCRGACWWPIDPVGLHAGDDELRDSLELVRAAHMNMVRIPGGTVYEDGRFWDLCDELGIMVWQDCMLGYTDPPQDEAFEAAVVAELETVFAGLGGRPALAVVCGGQEIEEQAAMFGLARQKWDCALIEKTIAALADRLLPGVSYVTSSPTGGDLPFQPDTGDCHYWGVGSYLRPRTTPGGRASAS